MVRLSVCLLFTAVVCFACHSPKKLPETLTEYPELYRQIARQDSLLFDAFNHCDLDRFKTFFADDLEFYHDLSGLTDYRQNMEAFANNCLENRQIKRILVEGSLEVYPVKDYGAIQEGKHRFCHPENGTEECAIFKFVHVWRLKDGAWKIARVVSYDH